MSNNNIYPIQLLNDLHNWFPDILYNPGRFRNVQDLLEYIRQGADVNPYTRGLQIYRTRQNLQSPTMGNATTTIPVFNRQTNYTQPHTTTIPATTTTPTSQTHLPTREVRIHTVPLQSMMTGFVDLLGDDLTNNILSQFLSPNVLQNFLEQTVQVNPSADEIQNATTTLTLSNQQDDNCAICQDVLDRGQQVRRINHCNHLFHRTCIDTWFTTNVHCPTCRHDIRNTSNPPPVSDNHRRTNIRDISG